MQSDLQKILLEKRGFTDPNEIEKYLHPNYDRDMHDPLLMHDMERAVVRFFEAIESKEKIAIYADYDCDGIPGAVIAYDLLKKIGYENFIIYIPDRHDEGYGLNKDALDEFIKQDVKLIVTIDLGTSDHEDIAYAQSNGIDVVVTDHHIPHDTLPKAFALVNPKIGTSYPGPMLCGAGVMFKFVQAFLKKYGDYFNIKNGWEKWLLDMAGLATLSDMVPLVGENRVIAYYGLQVLRKSPRPGLQKLLRTLKIDQKNLTEDDVTFMITPRINAASRMDSPMRAFELLSETDVKNAGVLAEHLSKINDERKNLVAHIMKEVKNSLSNRELGPVIVIGNPKWRIGVLGLVAGKICDEYERPVFVWGRQGDSSILKGSCRSDGSVNVVTLMEEGKEHFLDYGGHELAGGFSVEQEKIHALEDNLRDIFHKHKKDANDKNHDIDTELGLSHVNDSVSRIIESMQPFGLGNPKPLFMFPQVVVKNTKQFGKEKNHLEIIVSDDNGEKTAISFFADSNSFSRPVKESDIVDLVATLEKSFFAGRTTLRLRIVDIM